MNNEQEKARDLAELLTAFADGKQLQIYYSGESMWRNFNPTVDVLLFRFNEGIPIRIKPETEQVPLTMQDLIDRELRKDTMRLSNSELILSWNHNFVTTVNNTYSYSYLLDNELTFLDGNPCYKEVNCE